MRPVNDQQFSPTANSATEMTHEEMIARWYEGLAMPMSSTINTFAKTEGSWWKDTQSAWVRVCAAEQNEQLDFHHERFGKVEQAKGPASNNGRSPWEGNGRRLPGAR